MNYSDKLPKRTLNYFPCLCIFSLLVFAGCEDKNSSASIDSDDISGQVTGTNGPEAGVWVIAETFELPTRYAKIVVTDDGGNYLLPDLPDANYSIWVRGYGLIDSEKVQAKPGATVDLTAVEAPDPHAAAEYYPAGYWFSLLDVPDRSNFPGTGPEGNGISPTVKTQAQYLMTIKSGTCLACHQLGSKGTREMPENLGTFENSVEAWDRRIQSGQAGGNMISSAVQVGKEGLLKMFADWTDRIAAGEVPEVPKRPEGIERNVVITQWDWADPKAYLHDLVSTDRRDPTVNPYGLIYGALELSADYLPVLDPVN
ncbi:MAG TPA: carboxypeptidase-like regulatory domain-containing protein, partial [Lunatimonas sp.]|nr:carboxypeptidase-like regulatory domain-containing protein [Lunatimonas sp.]